MPRLRLRLGGRAVLSGGLEDAYPAGCCVPIIYSAGDFIDDYAINEVERNNWSLLRYGRADPAPSLGPARPDRQGDSE